MFRSIRRVRTPVHGLSLAVILGLALTAAPVAQAAPPTASASAWDMQVNVSVVGSPALNLGHQNDTSFSNQTTATSSSDTALSFDSDGVLPSALLDLTTGEINTSVQWSPGNNFHVVGARAGIADLDLGVVSLLGDPLLSVAAQQIVATAIIAGSCPPSPPPAPLGLVGVGPAVNNFIFRNGFDPASLQPSSDVSVPGLAIAAMGDPLLNIPVDPEPNTSLGIPGVLTLVLNERTVGGDGVTSRSVATNALHLNLSVLGLVTAEVILSHAEAAITCH